MHDQFKSLKQIALEKSSNKDLQEYIKDKILILLNDEILREELSKKSKAQAALFSWDKAAQEHLKVMASLLETRF